MKAITDIIPDDRIKTKKSNPHKDVQGRDIHTTHQPENEVLNILQENGYDFVVTHPCSKFSALLKAVEEEPRMRAIPVTREEEGVGICAGAYLAGKKPFMLIQSSGLGNSFNALASLIKTYKMPLLILASYRGYYHEIIPAQKPLGSALPNMLEAIEIPFHIISKSHEEFEMTIIEHSNDEHPYVILLSPEFFKNAKI